MMNSRTLAVAQLFRLPNVFTAFADILLGAMAAGALVGEPGLVFVLVAASGCLYLSGMGWNDYFDRHTDARTQPFRPIPSGQVSSQLAAGLSAGLMVLGLLLAALATILFPPPAGVMPPVAVACILAGAITLYNAWLKHTPFGPLAMGSCRALNVGLGLSAGVPDVTLASWLMAVVGIYITGVTLFARTEEFTSARRPLRIALLLIVIAGLGAAFLPTVTPELRVRAYPYLLAIWAVWVGGPVVLALREPDPKRVQRAVKRLIFGLVPLDAVLAVGVGGGPFGLAILLLLVPAFLLGRRVYST